MTTQANRLFIFVAMLTLLWPTRMAAADQKVHPAKDDPDLYSSYCFFLENFSIWLDARAAAVSARKATLTASAARYLNVSVADFPKVTAACRLLTADLRRIDVQAHDAVASARKNGSRSDRARLNAFESQRQAAIQTAVSGIKQQLTATGWSALNDHINGTHRQSVVRFTPVSVSPPGTTGAKQAVFPAAR